MQHDPALRDTLTYPSPTSGERVGLSFIQPKSIDDLIRRRNMVKTWMDATCGMFGRSPDFMNITLTGFASAAETFGARDRKFSDNIWNYYLHCRENDVAMTHTLINPQVDRSKPVEQQDKDLAAKIVKETDAGIVISGARMVSTLCAYSHDLLVMPSTYLANNEEAKPYAFGFATPVNAPGLRFVCRPSVIHMDAGSPMDYPLSARLDETDAMVVFDNVLIPWERVFIHRDAEMCNGLYNRTGAMPQIMHQFSTKNLAKAEFMMAVAFAIARSTKIDAHLHVQGMLAEMIQFTEFVRACLRASEADAKPNAAASYAGRDAAVDRADDVPENVHPHVRDHPDARRRRARRGAVLCGAERADRGRCRDLFPGRQCRLALSDQAVPPGLRRRGIVVLRPPAALRALLFGRSGPARRDALRHL